MYVVYCKIQNAYFNNRVYKTVGHAKAEMKKLRKMDGQQDFRVYNVLIGEEVNAIDGTNERK